jgi:hypothetical protein
MGFLYSLHPSLPTATSSTPADLAVAGGGGTALLIRRSSRNDGDADDRARGRRPATTRLHLRPRTMAAAAVGNQTTTIRKGAAVGSLALRPTGERRFGRRRPRSPSSARRLFVTRTTCHLLLLPRPLSVLIRTLGGALAAMEDSTTGTRVMAYLLQSEAVTRQQHS